MRESAKGSKAANRPGHLLHQQQVTTKRRGDLAELLAREHLQRRGLRWVQSNFRTPGRGGGEIDLIMCEPDGTLVFVEVRQRSRSDFGGAAASIGAAKRRRIVLAARHYLMRLSSAPPCRFDAVLVQGMPGDQLHVEWIKAAFDASGF
ncbi:MAG: YraN family protein [Betaproteobacteria bacterium]|nr:YraN family protein [Betaproteobacteria bacterium]